MVCMIWSESERKEKPKTTLLTIYDTDSAFRCSSREAMTHRRFHFPAENSRREMSRLPNHPFPPLLRRAFKVTSKTQPITHARPYTHTNPQATLYRPSPSTNLPTLLDYPSRLAPALTAPPSDVPIVGLPC